MRFRVHRDPSALSRDAAKRFAEAGREALAERGRFAVALAGGRTPSTAYRILATDLRDAVDWTRTHAFFSDERCVPPEYPDSNFRMARETLLDHVPAIAYRVRGEAEPESAALEYESLLRGFFGEEPSFDLVLLGMGADGHTASLFPGSRALSIEDRWVAAVNDAPGGIARVTLTFPVLLQARAVLVLAAGPEKAEALREVLRGSYAPGRFPAQRLREASGDVLWLVDVQP
jgi:6-phosphogluconolactonase